MPCSPPRAPSLAAFSFGPPGASASARGCRGSLPSRAPARRAPSTCAATSPRASRATQAQPPTKFAKNAGKLRGLGFFGRGRRRGRGGAPRQIPARGEAQGGHKVHNILAPAWVLMGMIEGPVLDQHHPPPAGTMRRCERLVREHGRSLHQRARTAPGPQSCPQQPLWSRRFARVPGTQRRHPALPAGGGRVPGLPHALRHCAPGGAAPPFAPEKPPGDDRSVLVWAPDTATAGPPS